MEEKEFEACVRQIQAGEKDGLKRIYQAYAGLIYTVVYDMVRQREDAQDIASDFFIRLWEKADTYRFGGKHRAWLLTIARNMAIDFLRKQKRELPMEELDTPKLQREDIADEVVESISFREVMEQLKFNEREVLNLKILGQLTFREIAGILGKPQGTVSWLYRQGIEKLRRYQKNGQEVQG